MSDYDKQNVKRLLNKINEEDECRHLFIVRDVLNEMFDTSGAAMHRKVASTIGRNESLTNDCIDLLRLIGDIEEVELQSPVRRPYKIYKRKGE